MIRDDVQTPADRHLREFTFRNNGHDIAGARIGGAIHPLLDVIIGLTPNQTTVEDEYEKVLAASELGVEIVTDVSTTADSSLRRRVLEAIPIAFRTVPTYEIHRRIKAGEAPRSATLREIEQQAEDGVDCVTIHATGAPLQSNRDEHESRIIPVTSRGGAMMTEVMLGTEGANPYVECFDEILDICRANGMAISLATTARPGSVADALSRSHLAEMGRQGELARRSHARGVNVVIEVLGHVPLNLIPAYCDFAWSEFDGAPFGALGPCTTDIAMAHDDIAGAIGAAVAAMHGVSFIACLTAGEHCRLPNLADVKSAIKAFQIALHVGWIARTGDLDRDAAMSRARNANDWTAMAAAALHPTDAREVVDACGYHTGQVCSMCGSACPIVRTSSLLRKTAGGRV